MTVNLSDIPEKDFKHNSKPDTFDLLVLVVKVEEEKTFSPDYIFLASKVL